MDDALGNALMVEVGDLLAEDEVLQQARAARAALQRVLVVRDRRRPGWWSACSPPNSTSDAARRRSRRKAWRRRLGSRLAGRALGRLGHVGKSPLLNQSRQVNVGSERRVAHARTRPKPSQAADRLNADGIGIRGPRESRNPRHPHPAFDCFSRWRSSSSRAQHCTIARLRPDRSRGTSFTALARSCFSSNRPWRESTGVHSGVDRLDTDGTRVSDQEFHESTDLHPLKKHPVQRARAELPDAIGIISVQE